MNTTVSLIDSFYILNGNVAFKALACHQDVATIMVERMDIAGSFGLKNVKKSRKKPEKGLACKQSPVL